MPVIDGEALADGDAVAGTGALVEADALSEWNAGDGSYFGSFGGFCEAREIGVVVLDEVALPSP
ncbi:hypothetical protein [Demequina sp. NBRC 110053]|uniref:hypothetical protein n=1 Tax=Demequina sp. NBRC 110053 TaxID=1570342 RepID=UPI000A02103E|nr:hypothetical protein [Demequina sp. NBRC 110053]